MHGKAPGLRHNMLLEDLRGVTNRYSNLPVVERLAVVAQFVGQLVRDVPDGPYTKDEILKAVAGNIHAGNARDDSGPGALEGIVGHG